METTIDKYREVWYPHGRRREDLRWSFKVTGVDRAGKRFRVLTDNWIHAAGINLWRGSVWENCSGKWKLVRRVY